MFNRKAKKNIISPTSGLLLLLQKHKNDTKKYADISQIIINGRNEQNSNYFDQLMDEISDQYEISFDANFIHNDPVRRYFETHLAKTTLDNTLSELSINRLTDILCSLQNLIPRNVSFPEIQTLISDLDKIIQNPDQLVDNEYRKALSDLNRENTEEALKKSIMIKSAVTAVYLTRIYSYFDDYLPLDIYGTGAYAPEYRGVNKKSNIAQANVTSSNGGLLKSHHPLPISDEAFLDAPTMYMRAADQSRYESQAIGIKKSMALYSDPFSNGLSGTMLAQIRTLQYLMQTGKLRINDSEVIKYLTLFASNLLFSTGGHTHNEYLAVLQLPEIQIGFRPLVHNENFEISDLVLNGKGIDEHLLDKCIQYISVLNKKQSLHQELINNNVLHEDAHNNQDLSSITESNHNLSEQTNGFCQQDLEIFMHAILSENCEIISKKIKAGISVNIAFEKGITPLMLAAQKGKIKAVKELITLGANVHAISRDKKTALDYARDVNNADLIKILLPEPQPNTVSAGKLSKIILGSIALGAVAGASISAGIAIKAYSVLAPVLPFIALIPFFGPIIIAAGAPGIIALGTVLGAVTGMIAGGVAAHRVYKNSKIFLDTAKLKQADKEIKPELV